MADVTGNTDSKILVGLAIDPRETTRLYSQIANIAARVPPVRLKFQNQGVLGTMAKDASEFERSLGAASSRVLSFGATAGILYSVSAAFTALVKSTIDVEKQLKDINVVLGLSTSGLQSLSKELFKVASDTGQAFNVATKAALEFSRQGLSVEQTLKRTKDALILTRLSGLDVAQSVETITAALNGFNDATLTSTILINKLATVDAAFAVSTADLAEAFTRVGSTASDAGVSLDSLIGIVTSAQQSTARGGAVIGNSLKTIFQRVTRSTTLETLKQFNVEVEDLQGNVLSADRILINLAKSFKGASVEQQNFITQLAAGVFQSNQFRAILNDLAKESSVYSRALLTSSNATDQAAQRNAELNKTLSSSIQEIKNRFTELGSTIGNLTIKTPVDAFSKVFKTLDDGLKSGDNVGVEAGVSIGTGILKGLGDYLAGPGAATAAVLAFRLFANFGGFAAKAFGRILENNTKEFQVRQAINNLLLQSEGLNEKIRAGGLSQLQIQEAILATLKGQSIEYARQGQIVAATKTLAAAGNIKLQNDKYVLTPRATKAVGHIPAAQERAGAYAGGYTPGAIKEMNIPALGKVVYNTAEKVKKFPGMAQPAIMPPLSSKAGINYKKEFVKSHGFDPYKSEGLVPNYAALIRAAAIKYKDKIFTGSYHGDALVKMGQSLGFGGDIPFPMDYDEGFISRNGKFISREVAAKITGLKRKVAYSEDYDFHSNKGLIPNFAQLSSLVGQKYFNKRTMLEAFVTPTIKGTPDNEIGPVRITYLGKFSKFPTPVGHQVLNEEKLDWYGGIEGYLKEGPYGSPDWKRLKSAGLIPNFLPINILKGFRQTRNDLASGNFRVENTLETYGNFKKKGYKISQPAGLYDTDSKDIVLDSSLVEGLDTYKNTTGDIIKVLAHEGAHKIIDSSNLSSRLAQKSPNFLKNLRNKRLIPTYSRFKDIGYESSHFLEEAIADGTLREKLARPELQRGLGLSDKQVGKINRLYNRLLDAAQKGADVKGFISGGLVPNYARFDTKLLESITKEYQILGKKMPIKERNQAQIRTALSLSEKTKIPAESLLLDKDFQDEFRRYVPNFASRFRMNKEFAIDNIRAANFPIDEFDRMKAIDRIAFAEKNFSRLGRGSSRTVYDIPNTNYVLKLAGGEDYNTYANPQQRPNSRIDLRARFINSLRKGVNQNIGEADPLFERFREFVPNVYRASQDYTYLISERANDFDKFNGKFVSEVLSNKFGEDIQTGGDLSYALQIRKKQEAVQRMREMFDLSGAPIADFHSGNLGIGMREGKASPLLIDYGFSRRAAKLYGFNKGLIPSFARDDRYRFRNLGNRGVENVERAYLSADNREYYGRAYEDYNNVVKSFAPQLGVSNEQFATVFSKVSPSNPVERNILDTISVIGAHNAGRGPSDIRTVGYPANKEQAFKFLQNKQSLTGVKRTAFAENILNPFSSQLTTVDYRATGVYAGKVYTPSETPVLGDRENRIIQSAYSRVAEKHNTLPLNIQAATWYDQRIKHGKDTQGFNRSLIDQLLKDGIPDFEEFERLKNNSSSLFQRRGQESLFTIPRSGGLVPNYARGERYLSSSQVAINPSSILELMSRDERRVLVKLGEGASLAEIASEMKLPPNAVSTLIENAKKSFTTKYGLARQGKLNFDRGLIPNFNALSSAIARENKAGIPMSQIRVGQSPVLKSSLNPNGLGVYNTKDEPLGLNQGIQRAVSMGLNPKTHGVPNFAPQYSKNIPDPFKDPFDRPPVTKDLDLSESLALEDEIAKLKNQIKIGTRDQASLASATSALKDQFSLTAESAKKINQRLQASLKVYNNRPRPAQSSLSGLTGDLFGSQFVATGSGKQGEFLPITQQAELASQTRQKAALDRLFLERNAVKNTSFVTNKVDTSILKSNDFYKRLSVRNATYGPSRETFDFERAKLRIAEQEKAEKTRLEQERASSTARTRKSLSTTTKQGDELIGLQSQKLQQKIKENREKRSSVIPLSPNSGATISYIPLPSPNKNLFNEVLTVASFKEQFGPSREKFDEIKFKERIARQEQATRERPFRQFERFTSSGKASELSKSELTQELRRLTREGRGLPEQERKEFIQRIGDFYRRESASRELSGLQASAGKFGGLGLAFSSKSRADFEKLKGINPNAARDITTSLQNKAFVASIAAPVLAGVAQQTIGTETRGQRGAGAIAGALGNAAGFASLGGTFAGPVGAIAGGVGGLLVELPNIFKSFSDTLPDLQKRFGELQDVSQKTSASFGEYIESSEKLAEAFKGNITGLTNRDIENLKSSQRNSLLGVANLEDRNRISSLVESGNLVGAREQISKINERNAQNLNITGISANLKTILPNILTSEAIKARNSKGTAVTGGSFLGLGAKITSTLDVAAFQKEIESNNKKRENAIAPIEQATLGLTSLNKKTGDSKTLFDILLGDKTLTDRLQKVDTGKFNEELSDLLLEIGGFDTESIARLKESFKDIETSLKAEGTNLLKERFSRKELERQAKLGENFTSSAIKSANALVLFNKFLDDSRKKFEELGTAIQISGIKNVSKLTSSLRVGEIEQKGRNEFGLLRGGGEGLRNLFNFQEGQTANQNRAQIETRGLQVASASQAFSSVEQYRINLIDSAKKDLEVLFKDSPKELVDKIKNIQSDFDNTFIPLSSELEKTGTINQEQIKAFTSFGEQRRDLFEKFQRTGGLATGVSQFINKELGGQSQFERTSAEDSKIAEFIKNTYPDFSDEDIKFVLGKTTKELQEYAAQAKNGLDTSKTFLDDFRKINQNYAVQNVKIQEDLKSSNQELLAQFNENVKLLGEQRAVSLENTRRTGEFNVNQSRKQFDLSNSALGLDFRGRNEIAARQQFESSAGSLIGGAIGKPEFNGLINQRTEIADIDKLLKQQEAKVSILDSVNKSNAALQIFNPEAASQQLAALEKEKDALNALKTLKTEINNAEKDSLESLRQTNIEEEKNLRLLSGRLAEIQKINDGLIRASEFGKITRKLGSDFSESLSFTSSDFYKTLSDNNLQFAQEFKQTFKDGFAEAATGASKFSDALRNIAVSLGKNIVTKASNLATDQLFGALFGKESNLLGGNSGIFTSVLSSFSGSGQGPKGQYAPFAKGGLVKKYATGGFVNQGSGIRDDVPALLSGGEFVIRKSSTQKLGKDFLDFLNNNPEPTRTPVNNGFNYTFANEYVGVGDKKRPTSGYANISPLLSDIALNDENNPQNALRLSREQYFRDLADYNFKNSVTLREFEKAQTSRRTSAYISAGINLAGSAGSAYSQFNTKGFDNSISPNFKGYNSVNLRRAFGGVIPKYYSGGGSVFGGNDIKDTIPAYLMGGEFVFNKNTTERIGKNNLDYMNKTGKIPGFAAGGYVGSSPVSYGGGDYSLGKYMTESLSILSQIKDKISGDSPAKESGPQASKGVGEISINNSIVVYMSESGVKASSTTQVSGGEKENNKNNQDKQAEGKEMGNLVIGLINQTLEKESRPGGKLYEKFVKK